MKQRSSFLPPFSDDRGHPGDRGQHPGLRHPHPQGDAQRLQPAPRLHGLLRLHLPLRVHPGELQEAVQHGLRVRVQQEGNGPKDQRATIVFVT